MSSKRDSAWQDAAFFAARKVLRRHKGCVLLAEDILRPVIDTVGEPADRRSFGGVIRRLRADGHIKPSGVGRARSSHGSLKPRWRAVA